MSEEEKKAIETFIKKCERYDGSVEIKGISVGEETRILNTIVKFLKELNNLKEIEKSHKEENGKLRVELEQYKLLEANIDKANKIIAENKFDEGLYGLLMQEKEKNKELEEKLKISVAILTKGTYPEENEGDNDFDKQFIAVDKIKEKIEETNSEKLNYSEDEYYLENEIKGYAIDKLKELLEMN